MSNEQKTLWYSLPYTRDYATVYTSSGETLIATMKAEHAAQIVRCVNNHDALVAALETVLANAPEPYCAITRAVDRQVREALAAARGEL